MVVETKAHRILIVEDEALIAMQLESSLIGLGHNVEAIATRMDKAVLLAESIEIDFAVLDINMAGILSFPIAGVNDWNKVIGATIASWGSHTRQTVP